MIRATDRDGGESPCTTRSRNLSGRIATSVSSSRSGRVRRGGATLAGTSRCTCGCRTRGRTFGTVTIRLDAYPDSIRARDPRGLYPVHVAAAASSDVPIDVVYRLARACPEALLNLGRNVLAQEKARPVRPATSSQGSPAVVRKIGTMVATAVRGYRLQHAQPQEAHSRSTMVADRAEVAAAAAAAAAAARSAELVTRPVVTCRNATSKCVAERQCDAQRGPGKLWRPQRNAATRSGRRGSKIDQGKVQL
jgi:hypothetical protein